MREKNFLISIYLDSVFFEEEVGTFDNIFRCMREMNYIDHIMVAVYDLDGDLLSFNKTRRQHVWVKHWLYNAKSMNDLDWFLRRWSKITMNTSLGDDAKSMPLTMQFLLRKWHWKMIVKIKQDTSEHIAIPRLAMWMNFTMLYKLDLNTSEHMAGWIFAINYIDLQIPNLWMTLNVIWQDLARNVWPQRWLNVWNKWYWPYDWQWQIYVRLNCVANVWLKWQWHHTIGSVNDVGIRLSS